MTTSAAEVEPEEIAGLIGELEGLGVQLWEESGQLRFRSPQGIMNDARRARLRASKVAVLGHLRAMPRVTVTPHPEDRFEPFPLTQVQSAYLLGRSDAFAYGGTGCHAYGEIIMREIDSAQLQNAWRALIARHDMLRVVVSVDGSQRVQPEVPEFCVITADLRHADPSDVQTQIERVRRELDHKIYAPGEWPLFDVRVTQATDHAILHVSIDFLIADYVSIRILFEELRQLYDEPTRALPRLSTTFRDYLLAERSVRSGSRFERDRQYWLKRVDTLPGAPELPLLDATTRGMPVRFRRFQFVLPTETWRALREHAAAQGLTSSSAVLAAYAETIAHWSHNPCFMLDITLLQRLPLHPEVGALVGDFTSVSLLAVDARAAGSFNARATAIQTRLWDDLDHRLYSGIDVMRDIARHRGASAALMPVIFTSAIGLNAGTAGAGPAWGEIGYGISQTPQAWIDCQALERGERLELNWDVRENVLREGVAEDMFGAFVALLSKLAAETATWTAADPLELPETQLQRRAAANDTKAPVPHVLLHEPIVARSLETPHHIAIISSRGTLTYEELIARSRATARALYACGCKPGDVIAVLMDTGPEQAIGVIATHLCGAAYLPIEAHHPTVRRDRMLENARPTAALMQSALGGESCPASLRRLDVDTIAGATPPGSSREPSCAAPDDVAYIIYTSGSTGTPKGVTITHRGAGNTIADMNRRFGITAQDRILGVSSLAFDLSVYDIFGTLWAGACLVMPDHDRRDDPSHWAQLIAECGVTVWNSVPIKMQMLLDYLDSRPPIELPLRLIFLSGDWISVALARRIQERFAHANLISLGGATEASIWSIWHPIGQLPADLKRIPYGRPLANQTFHVLDESLRNCPDAVVGDLYIGGVGLATGYFGDAVRTAAKFIVHPHTGERLYRTGDQGRYLPDGNIEFLGRNDSQLKIRGNRVELGEIEAALESDPDVAAAVVVVHGEGSEDKRLSAFVVAQSSAQSLPDSADLAARLQLQALRGAAQMRAEIDGERVLAYAKQLDETALLAMLQLFQQHDLFGARADGHSSSDVALRTRAIPRYHRLIRRWLGALEANGMLRHERGTGSYFAQRSVELADVQAAWSRVEMLRPEADSRRDLLDYFRTASEHLGVLLRGECDPVQLLFPDGRTDVQEVGYQDNLVSRYLNRLVGCVIREIGSLQPQRRLRLLELGAGVGGTSSAVIPALTDVDIDYLYTDVSQFLLNRASERFSAFPFVRYGLFDMNEDYRSQGLAPNSFDMILCANAMHYATDAPATLARLRELLQPGGWLIFIELVRDNYQMMTSLEFLYDDSSGGIRDERQRDEALLIGREKWDALLQAAGACALFCLPAEDDPLSQIGFRVFGAQFKAQRQRLAPEKLTMGLRTRLPDYMVPAAIEVIDAMPVNSNGKVDRPRLKSWISHGEDRAATTQAEEPATDLERRLASLWAAALGRPQIPRNRDFFALGGDSLAAAQLARTMREQLVEAKESFFENLLRILLDGPTIEELAARLEALAAGSATAVAPATPATPLITLQTGEGPLFAFVHDSGGTLVAYGALMSELPQGRGVVGLVLTNQDTYLKLPPEVAVQRVAADYAAVLRQAGNRPLHLVGYEAGAVLALETARILAEGGVSTALTLISALPVPFRIDDELLAEYFSIRAAGLDPTHMGFPAEAALARALGEISARSEERIPEGSLARTGGDPELDGVAWCFRRLALRTREDRRATIANRLEGGHDRPMNTRDVGTLVDLFQHSVTGAALSELSPYLGDVTLLRPQEPSPFWGSSPEDLATFWRARCLGVLNVVDIPGSHYTCLKPAHASGVWHLLNSRAERP